MKRIVLIVVLFSIFLHGGIGITFPASAQDNPLDTPMSTLKDLQDLKDADAKAAAEAAKKAKSDAAKNLTPTSSSPFYTGGLYKNTDPSRYSIDGLVNIVLPGAAKWIAGFLGALAVIFLIWAGIQFLTADGEPEKISQAIKTAFYVIAGVLLMMFASALVYLFLTIFAP
jgi:outer membrane murein-binding lipoprotein Lpp